MKAQNECLVCIYNQILRISKVAKISEDDIETILKLSSKMLSNANLNLTPPELAQPLYELVYNATKNKDPYEETKDEHIRRALEIYPTLKAVTTNANDPLLESIKIAIIGNAIDLGSTIEKVDINLEEFLQGSFVLDDYEKLKEDLNNTNEILYLGDNAGESVFDRVLIEEFERLNKSVLYAVKSKPIINDVTREDAEKSQIKNIIETGSKYAGTVVYSLSEDFLNKLHSSKLIIAKGQANYETLSNTNLPVYFLLKVKCVPISRSIGFPIGTNILLKNKNC